MFIFQHLFQKLVSISVVFTVAAAIVFPSSYSFAQGKQGTVLQAPPGGILHAKLGDKTSEVQLSPQECEELVKLYLTLQNEISQLDAAITFSEQFFLVKQTIDQAREVLDSTKEDSEEKAEKIQDLNEKIRINNAQLQEMLKQLNDGLKRVGEPMEEISETLGHISAAMDTLEIAVRARNMTAAQSMQAFADYFDAIAGKLEPLVKALPVIGTFIYLYSQGIKSCVKSTAAIEREYQRRNALMKEISGKTLYVMPGNEEQAKQRAISEKRQALEDAADKLGKFCYDRVRVVNSQVKTVDQNDFVQILDKARENAMKTYSDLGIQVSHAQDEAYRASKSLDRARGALDQARTKLTSEDTPQQLASVQRQLEELGPEKVLTLSGNMSEKEKEKAIADFEAKKKKRSLLKDKIRIIQGRMDDYSRTSHEFAKKQEMYSGLRQQALKLKGQYIQLQREYLLKEAKAKNWDEWWLRLKYPDLFTGT